MAYMIPAAIISRMDLRYSVICALIKSVFTLLEPNEVQALVPPTRATYEQWIRAHARQPAYRGRAVLDVQPLSSGKDSALLWLGNRRRARKVVLYIPGGGFVIPMLPGHLDLCWQAFVAAGLDARVEVAVAMLQYTLVPRGRMPTQLDQVVAAFAELRAQGFAPRDIIVGGESAGGNLTMQFAAHLLRPHPQVPAVALPHPLAAVVVISAGLGSDADGRSFRENKDSDMITEPLLRRLAEGMLPEGEAERPESVYNPWARPLDSDPAFWARLGDAVTETYFMVGDRELLADHSRSMAALVKKQAPDVVVRLEEMAGQPHAGILLEATLGKVGESLTNMKKWYSAHVSSK
ncbi:alpha/beta hydrolase fold-3 [Cordyceps fumosorosea ARSEF 2679]|uniref:Alpha/beta hydrolase fold-3 n=1 Tax=Cordyceps fumosorosea (strain ARSEF 2679) TaxID=1081104 RepID=A0A167TJR8_CORFA|nr:alpha/beta hydrolase fold-3 [Cordyceps fumosorosea ARSEF 2679]OAA60671.1 alpha/beta hydrolase fold-3 [Cordyceps fumosorosea ARSEF 2679]